VSSFIFKETDETRVEKIMADGTRSRLGVGEVLTFNFGVGDEMLDLALARANLFSRYVMCGGISHYNTTPTCGPKVSHYVVIRNLTSLSLRG